MQQITVPPTNKISCRMDAEKFTNYEISSNLDSSDSFEGPEKTLRLYFSVPAPKSLSGQHSLLTIPREEWESMLGLVKCKVLSVLVHPKIHAYVLSESSLFVHSDSIVLKTCGTTTLLAGLSAILEIVQKFTESPFMDSTVTAAFYSRRSYFQPSKQCHPHGCWDDEVSQLKRVFHGPTFASHFGVNRDERWHLFTHCSSTSTNHGTEVSPLSGGWLEIMMTGLDHKSASRFYIDQGDDLAVGPSMEDSVLSLDSVESIASAVGAEPDDDDPGHKRGNIMTRTARIDELFKSDRQCIDSFAFSPCGYSCNGILLDEGQYFTIHVTPERGASYASFETNVSDPSSIEAGLDYQKLIARAVSLFDPLKLTVVLFSPLKSPSASLDTSLGGAYTCTSEACCDIGNACITQLFLKKNC